MERRKLLAVFFIIIFTASNFYPCTTFCFKDKNGNIYYGRNFDFPSGLGHVQINLRKQLKSSFNWPGSGEKPFTWISKYGSISFNQNGREFPYGGMNEAGLVIEQMWLASSKYPPADERTGLTELQWIQYQLDNASSVEDVIKSDNTLRVSYTSRAPIHFLVSDAMGNTAVIEYIDGKMVYKTGEKLQYSALANDTYEYSLDYKLNKDSGGNKEFKKANLNSLDRFFTAASMLKSFNPDNISPVEYAFGILQKVAQANGTQWSIVYDVRNKCIHYKTASNPQIRKLKFSDFNFAGNSKWLFIDIDETKNNAGNFKLFNFENNFKLIDEVWSNVEFLKSNPKEVRAEMARFPETVKFAESK